MRQSSNRKGKFKTDQQRTEKIPLRASPTEKKLIDDLSEKRVKYSGYAKSRTDTIIACVKFATGTMDIFEIDQFQKSVNDLKSI